ncbi:MAG: hypothetical protein SFY56_14735 [Bacteroidota bacterium]|nr:hypothetical protein [Bacteroidota bacterium]
MNVKLFIKSLPSILLALVIAVSSSLALNSTSVLICNTWWTSILFYTLVFLILNVIYNLKRNEEEFTQLLLATIIIKLLLALTFILVYKVIDSAHVFNFAMHFLIHYLIFTVFEMYYLLKLIKSKQKNL